MGKIKLYTITVAMEENSDLISRLEGVAGARGIGFETVLEDAVNIGLWPHVTRNVDLMERACKEAIP